MLSPKQSQTTRITSGTKEWADYNINCFKGCYNNCRYCYAKMMGKRFGRCTDKTWKKMYVRNDVLKKKFGKFNGRVMFPSSHDIIDKKYIKKICYVIIEKLLEAENEVLITTKPSYNVTRDIIRKFEQFREYMQFRFTITSLDDRKLSFWEPNAPLFEERFSSLRLAYENDIKTSVSIEPFLDYEPHRLVKEISPFITESIWLGPMNYIPRNNIPKRFQQQYEDIRRNYEVSHLKEIFEDLKDVPKMRFKDSMAIRLKIPTVHQSL